jgi:hypothetical protein
VAKVDRSTLALDSERGGAAPCHDALTARDGLSTDPGLLRTAVVSAGVSLGW